LPEYRIVPVPGVAYGGVARVTPMLLAEVASPAKTWPWRAVHPTAYRWRPDESASMSVRPGRGHCMLAARGEEEQNEEGMDTGTGA